MNCPNCNHEIDLHEHDEQLRLKIWREAPDQPDIQKAVIANLDLVHRHAIEKAVSEVRKPLMDALKEARKHLNTETVPFSLDGTIAVIKRIDDALAKVEQ